jgi:MFS family permease
MSRIGSAVAAFLIGGALAGAGAGVLFKSALAAYVAAAEPSKRGEAASSLFLAAYLGLIIPVLGMGLATLYVSAQTAMLVFAGALLVILAAVATIALRAIRPIPSRLPGAPEPVTGAQLGHRPPRTVCPDRPTAPLSRNE